MRLTDVYPFNPARFAVDSTGEITDRREEFIQAAFEQIDGTLSRILEDANRPQRTYRFVSQENTANAHIVGLKFATVAVPIITPKECGQIKQEIYERLIANQYHDNVLHELLYGRTS